MLEYRFLGIISIFGFALMFITTQISENVIIRLMKDNEVLLLMNNNILMLRRREKDFMLRRDEKYMESFLKDYDKIVSLMRDKIRDPAILDKGLTLSEAYKTDFMNLVDKEREFGLKQADGIQGEVRASIHSLEVEMDAMSKAVQGELTERKYKSQVVKIIVITALALFVVFALLLLTLNLRSLMGRLHDKTDELLIFGNLAKDKGVKSDTKCEISKAINLLDAFKQKVLKVMISVQDNSDKLSEVSVAVSSASEQLSLTVSNQSDCGCNGRDFRVIFRSDE